MKTIVFLTINKDDEISSNLIKPYNNGIILVMRGENYIGYILTDCSSNFSFYNNLNLEINYMTENSFDELVARINKTYHVEDNPISYKYIEFK